MHPTYDFKIESNGIFIIAKGGSMTDVADNHEPERMEYRCGKFELMDKEGKEIVPLIYDD